MSATYFGILTKIGEAKQANSLALGISLKLTQLAVGDGGGNTPTPNREQTQLIGEWRRAPLNQLYIDANNPNYLVAEQVIPETAGGKWIREWGLYDEDDDLVAVSNCPPTYKPMLAEGSGRTQVVRMVIMVASTAAFTLKIDPAVVLATRQYVDDGLNQKLDKTATAVAAHKLQTPRNFSITGGATAAAQAFDGSGNVALLVTALDMAKANAGILAVTRGGTGLNMVPAGAFLSGNGTGALKPRTPAEVFADLGVAQYIAEQLRDYSAPDCGRVSYFAHQAAPAGYLKANGAAVSVATYGALAGAIYCGNSLNATAPFGYRCTDPAKPATSRSTTGTYIVLPDLRGEFVRGWDDGRGVDVGRTLGSAQGDNVRGPTGGGNIVINASATLTLALGTGPTGALIGGLAAFGTSTADTRPRNVALLACIKF